MTNQPELKYRFYSWDEHFDPSRWRKLSATSYYRYSPDLQQLWWAAQIPERGDDWFWQVTNAHKLEAPFDITGPFETWELAAADCEAKHV